LVVAGSKEGKDKQQEQQAGLASPAIYNGAGGYLFY